MEKELLSNFKHINELLIKKKNNSSIVVGETISCVVDILNTISPRQKVLLVCLSRLEQKSLIEALNKKDFKVYIVEKEAHDISVEYACDMFNAPEDVRAVVCLDYALIDYALYFSKIRNIPLVYGANNLDGYSAFKTSIRIKNGCKYDFIKLLLSSRHVIVDTKKISALKEGVREVYDQIISSAFTLIEYRLVRFINKKSTYEEAYDLAKSAVMKTFGIIKRPINERNNYLFYGSLLTGLANFITKGELFYGLTFETLNLYKIDKNEDRLKTASILLKLSTLAFFNNVKTKKVPDYDERIKYIVNEFGEDRGELISAYNKTAKLYDKNQEKIKKFFSLNKTEIQNLITSLETAIKIANTLTDIKEKNNDSVKTLKYIGDFKESLNLATFLREKGITEFI